MSTTETDTIKETDWVLGDAAGSICHHAPTLKACKEWIAGQHNLTRLPTARRTDTPGVHYVALPDGGAYWAMDSAPTARGQGYVIPLPDVPATYGLQPGEACLVLGSGLDEPTALVWNRAGHISRQPVPDHYLADPDTWAETTTASRLRSIGITTYLGRREAGS